MATETIEPFESEAVSKSRSESAEGMEGVELHRTHPSSGTGYRAIKRHSTTITDAVSDQAHFARTRGDESLITDGKRIVLAKGVPLAKVGAGSHVTGIRVSADQDVKADCLLANQY